MGGFDLTFYCVIGAFAGAEGAALALIGNDDIAGQVLANSRGASFFVYMGFILLTEVVDC